MCYNPLQIPRRYLYGDKYLGEDGLSFVTVPCGHCGECLKQRKKSWSIRCLLESLDYDDSLFVTLTYDDEHLPCSVIDGIPCHPLVRSDLQKFFKRLRRDLDLEGRKIRYYACGEYGDTYGRPHFHAIVFGLSFYDRELIEENWSQGFVTLGDVNVKSCNYVCGYVQKKLDSCAEDFYPLPAPYTVMSKNIGKDYILKNYEELISNGYVSFRGFKIALPRYFWKQLEKEDIKDIFEIKRLRRCLSDKYLKQRHEHLQRIGCVSDYDEYQYTLRENEDKARFYKYLNDTWKRGKL